MSGEERRLGYLQLCAERRFHRAVMEAFEREMGLQPDEYWIEARPGGTPSWADNTKGARIADRNGARVMGWATHGDVCLGFPGESDEGMRRRLQKAAARRAEEFPRAEHVMLFALPDGVEVTRLGRR
ncbi:MAG: hypothetical protein M3540_03995 [Actinomycetota bacterium]|nr:hypothetical protein [Actinomycetota bacterium]